VKLLAADKDWLRFQLSDGEKAVLLDVLGLYPCVPPAYHRLSREPRDNADRERQRLLDEALAEQRAQHRRLLQALLHNPDTFRKVGTRWQMTLRRGDFDWLLQVLNDVRVGSWIALGSPEQLPRKLPRDAAQAAHACAMELAGLFQMVLLDAVEGETAP